MNAESQPTRTGDETLLFVGQSLELHTPPLAAALVARDDAPVIARTRRQLDAGAGALDINIGSGSGATDLVWLASVIRTVSATTPLFLDCASPATIAVALDLCEREGVAGPLVANSLPANGADDDIELLARTATRAQAGLVIAPRERVDDVDAPISAAAIEDMALRTLDFARAEGVSGPCYLDALAYPPAGDRPRTLRSLEVLARFSTADDAVPLVAVGNVGYGAPVLLRPLLRAIYATAAMAAGARAFILPVEQLGLIDLLRAGASADEPPRLAWLRHLRATWRPGAPAPEPPSGDRQFSAAAEMLFGR